MYLAADQVGYIWGASDSGHLQDVFTILQGIPQGGLHYILWAISREQPFSDQARRRIKVFGVF
ncbi:hypothetical protein C8255_06885 [filamentous cyanobacterium CCP3]|nr:hypothetical protein C8255_06885 [filamentous cyanobacterium CCP3]